MASATRNFRLPLPELLYRRLRDAAARANQSATVVARYAIEGWLRQQADLTPRSGSAQGGRRAVIVVSSDGFNLTPTWRAVVVVPVSTSETQARRGPTAVPLSQGVGGLSRASVAVGEGLKAALDLD